MDRPTLLILTTSSCLGASLGMKYEIPKFNNKQIEKMDDDTLFHEIRGMKKIIRNLRRSKSNTKEAEEEISYLQAEAQNRGHNI